MTAGPGDARRARMLRRLGTAALCLGLAVAAYAATVVFWRDPATDVYQRWRQHQLSAQLARSFAAERAAAARIEAVVRARSEPAAGLTALQAAVRAYRARVELGAPLGRLVVPRLSLDVVVVQGLRWGADLSRAPGHYPETPLPGAGGTAAVAGHRTTFGAPFRHIDRLRPGDTITFVVPYARLVYRVGGHRIVDSHDWSMIAPQGFDALVLTACHPLWSARQRWVVAGRLVRAELASGAVLEGAALSEPGPRGASSAAAPAASSSRAAPRSRL